MAVVSGGRGRKKSDTDAPELVAVVARTRSAARRAARFALPALAGGRTHALPMTLEDYLGSCRSSAPIPLVLVRALARVGPRSVDEADRRFFEAARERLLWRLPAADVYDAIAGLRTDLAPLRRSARRDASDAEPYLLLEGAVTAVRAERALASPVRNWVVEHVGRVRIGERRLVRLAAEGVRWSVLRPVDLRGVVGPATRRKRVRRKASARRERSSRPSPR